MRRACPRAEKLLLSASIRTLKKLRIQAPGRQTVYYFGVHMHTLGEFDRFLNPFKIQMVGLAMHLWY